MKTKEFTSENFAESLEEDTKEIQDELARYEEEAKDFLEDDS